MIQIKELQISKQEIQQLFVMRLSRSVYKEERYHNKGGEGERDVAHFFCFLKQNFHVTRLMTYLS